MTARAPIRTLKDTMAATPLDLLNPSRKMIVVEIKERGEATAEHLATATYLSVAAVRMHLSALERLGLVEHATRRRGPGRPLHIYRLSPAGEDLFPQGYAELLNHVLEAISISPECSERIWGVIETQQVNALRRAIRADDAGERVRELFRSPDLRAFEPEVTDTADGWSVEMHHCPIVQAARCDPRVCETEQRIFRRVLGPDIELIQLENRRAGAARCSFALSPAGKK